MAEKNKGRATIDEAFIREQASTITDDDIRRVIDKAEEIKKRFSRDNPLGQFIDEFQLLRSMVFDYWSGAYREIPNWVIGAIVFALLYVLNPADIIPDVIPVVGYLDDAAVVSICLVMIEQQCHEYEDWKAKRAP